MADGRPDVERGGSARSARVPPHNLQAEESLLGAMLLSKDAIASAVETVGVEDFYKPAHGHIFDAITSLYGAGEPSDSVTVAEELRRAGLLDAIGGQSALVLAAKQHAGRRQRRPLRQDRRRACAAAPHDLRRR